MNRRTALTWALAGSVALIVRRSLGAAFATPATGAAIPPLRWELRQIASGNRVLVPDDPARFWLQFLPDGEVRLRADCNEGSGRYALDGPSLTLTELAATAMACGEGSLGERFLMSLGYVVSFRIAGDVSDRLLLEMMADGGTLTFEPALTGVVWEWVDFEGGDRGTVSARDPGRYTLEFREDGTVTLQADCNRGTGEATIEGSSVDLTVATTLIGCPDDSQGSDFLRYLDEANSFVIRDGMLALSLPADSGIARFRPALPTPSAATPQAGS